MQNGLKIVFILVGVFLLESVTCAKDYNGKISWSLVGMAMDYREYDAQNLILDSEKSDYADITGFELGYDFYFAREQNSYSEIDCNFMFVAGDTEYVGALLTSGLGYGSYRGTTQNSIGDTDITYRYNQLLNDSLTLSYGVGLGYRYWLRSLSATQEELYSWFSLRPSIGLDFKLLKGLSIAPVVEYQYGILPTMHESIFNYEFKLSSADIFELSIPINYEINEKIDISFEYLFQQQKIEKSDVIYRNYGGTMYGFWEPDSRANNQYLKFGMAFKY